MGLLSGLEKFGFKSLDKVEVYEEEKNKKEDQQKRKALSELTEPEMLFDKTYVCPVCEHEFKTKMVKANKAKLLGVDIDLRPKHQNIDTLKYGAILCRKCGFAALTGYFNNPISDAQIRLIKENISSKYSSAPDTDKDMYTYDEALEIHKMALLNAVVKRGKASEKAYICLKAAWLVRGKAELLLKENPEAKEEAAKLIAEEKEYLSEAHKGFLTAIETESSATICGMDSATVSYLCAALSYELGEYEEAQRAISRIYTMLGVNRKTKEKCITLKELIQEKLRKH